MEKRKYETKRSMTLQKVYRKWSEFSVGDVVVGKYVADHEDNYKKTNPVLKIEECFFKDGKDLKGQNLVINACGTVNQVFYTGKEPIKKGEIVQIEYTGTTEMDSGLYAGKDCHTMNIDVVGEVLTEEVSEEDVEL